MNEENVTALYDVIDSLIATYNISEEDIQALETALEGVLYPAETEAEEDYEEGYEEDLGSLDYEDED